MRSIFEISKSGLLSAQHGLSVTSNNIINADTPGYTRRRVEQGPVGMQGAQFHTGLGVNVTDINRLRNERNDILLNQKQQNMGFLERKLKVFEQLEASMVTDSGQDLDFRIGQLFDAFSELSNDPQDLSLRNNVVNEAVQLTQKLGEMSRGIDRTSDLVRSSVSDKVDSVNSLLRDINNLNDAIEHGQAKGKPDHTSLDIRVAKLEELSELVNFESKTTDTGAVEIQINGMTVLDETGTAEIRTEIDDVNKRIHLRLDNGHMVQVDGGKLGADIELFSQEIPGLRERLDQIASAIISEFNAIHSTGYDLNGNTNIDLFDDGFTTASGIRVNQNIIDDPRNIAASDTADEAGNGTIAAEIAELRNQQLIGGQKLIDYSVNLISTPGLSIDNLNSRIEAQDSEIQMLKVQQEREAGVNIDEELSLMIQYQNAYQGAAKVMSTAQQMYDTLLSLVR